MMNWRSVILALLTAGALVGSVSCSPREEAPSESSVARVTLLDRGTIPALRDSFNAAADRGRILVLLSPT